MPRKKGLDGKWYNVTEDGTDWTVDPDQGDEAKGKDSDVKLLSPKPKASPVAAPSSRPTPPTQAELANLGLVARAARMSEYNAKLRAWEEKQKTKGAQASAVSPR